MDAAYVELGEGHFRAGPLTGGPWRPDHQHAGPPSALICRAVERAAADAGLAHLGRLTVNLLRPAPIGECRIEVAPDYLGRNAGHFSGRLMAEGKDIARFTALMQREDDLARSRGDAGPSAAARAEAVARLPGGDDVLRRRGVRLHRPGREPAGGGAVLQRPLRGLVSPEPSVGQGRRAEPLSAGGGRRGFRQRHQRRSRLHASTCSSTAT